MTWTPNDSRPANLQVTINNTVIGAAQYPRTAGAWFPFSFEWDSGGSTTAVIKLVNLQTAQLDNDFALDDLSFSAVPEPSSALLVRCGRPRGMPPLGTEVASVVQQVRYVC